MVSNTSDRLHSTDCKAHGQEPTNSRCLKNSGKGRCPLPSTSNTGRGGFGEGNCDTDTRKGRYSVRAQAATSENTASNCSCLAGHTAFQSGSQIKHLTSPYPYKLAWENSSPCTDNTECELGPSEWGSLPGHCPFGIGYWNKQVSCFAVNTAFLSCCRYREHFFLN